MSGNRITNTATRIPRRVHMGERPSASRENHVRITIERIQALRNGIILSRPRPWAETMLHAITAIHGDYLECVRVWRNQTLGSEVVYVARPPLLRRSVTTWNGITYTYIDDQTRTATRGQDTEEQKVTPDYLVGDLIEVDVKRGTTGITLVDQQRGRPIDKNVDGRAWAKVPE